MLGGNLGSLLYGDGSVMLSRLTDFCSKNLSKKRSLQQVSHDASPLHGFYERSEKTGFKHLQKQRRRSASRLLRS